MLIEQVGFVGLGIMGQAMAKNVMRGDERFVVYNRSRGRTEPLAAMGATVAKVPREAAQGSQICFLMISNDQALEAVALGEDGVLAGMAEGGVVVDHSTVSPELTRRLWSLARERGVQWCDAPVTGGDVGARNATLTIMVGAEALTLEQITPLLQRMAQRVVHVGEVGQGQTMKLVSNLVGCLNLMAGAEGLRLGLQAGLTLAAIEDVLPNGTAQSFELQKILDRNRRQDFSPGFSVENRLKDLNLAVALARQVQQKIPLGERAAVVLKDHYDGGTGDLDESSYLMWWDR